MTPIERAARALVVELRRQDHDDIILPDDVHFESGLTLQYVDQNDVDCGALVRAVLQAIREPSQEMIIAGWGDHRGDPDYTGCSDNPPHDEAWERMIDAALGEGT